MKSTFRTLVLGALVMAGTAIAVQAQQSPVDIPRYTRIEMPYEWYREQAELWRKEIEADSSNARAWLNYYAASRYMGFTPEKRPPDHYERMAKIVDDMEKAIPETFEYQYVRWWSGGNDEKLFHHLERAFALRPDYALLSESFTVYYEMHDQRDKVAEFCREWYKTEELPRTTLNYQYNVFMSLEKNAILVTAGDLDTYPAWMLRYAKNVRPDVAIVNTSLMMAPEYRRRMMKELGIGGNADAATEAEFWKSVVESDHTRPIYFALTVPFEFIESFKDNLYTVGLANLYSADRVDNIAMLKKNWDRFHLDYLTIDYYDEKSPFHSGRRQMMSMNYIMPAALLYEHYMLAADRQKAEEFRELALRLAREGNQEKEVRDYFNGLAGGAANQGNDGNHSATVEIKEDMAFGDAVKVFPNPSYSGLTVQLPEAADAEIRMADTEGRIVRSVSSRGPEIRIDIAGLPAGAYILNIRTSRGTFTRNVQVVR